VHIVVAAEVLAFAKAAGVSSREAYHILMSSEAGSWIMGDRGLSMLNADWSPKSAVTIFTKDLVSVLFRWSNMSRWF
jgi:3-hydroxyisobutyrate dehydrogenase-like beta-hydroxyacid dehydrogenase